MNEDITAYVAAVDAAITKAVAALYEIRVMLHRIPPSYLYPERTKDTPPATQDKEEPCSE